MLESKYIAQYDSFKNGYNSTLGGEGHSGKTKSIDVYNETGLLINSYNSATEASSNLEISASVIRTICRKIQTHTYKNGVKLIFRYTGEELTEAELSQVKQNDFKKLVCMYNMDGECVKTFNNAPEASEVLDVEYKNINSCCNKKRNFVSIKGVRYIFRYSDDCLTEAELLKANSIKTIPNKPVRAIDSVTNEVLGEFKSLSDGARAFNIANKGNVIEASQGKRKTAGKFNGHGIR